MINARDTVTFSVGGQIFITRRSNLFRLPDSRLYMLAIQGKQNDEDEKDRKICAAMDNKLAPDNMSQLKKSPVYYFDRDPEIFRFVLDYYRTGELHLPSGICGPFVRKELIFWGVDESYILPCCMPAYMRYDEERRTKRTLFRDCFEDLYSIKNLLYCCRGVRRIRYQIWMFLEYPESSIIAKCWAMLLLLLMIGSVMCFCLSTHIAFRTPVNFTNRISHSTMNNQSKLNRNVSSANQFCLQARYLSNPKIHKDCNSEPIFALIVTDISLNLIFTLEFCLKIVLAPDKCKFLTRVVSIFDVIILASYWVYITVFYYHNIADPQIIDKVTGSFHLWVMNILSMTQVLRILRIFRISKISRGLQVLILTVKKSIPELVLLAFLLMNGMFLFSALIYMAEYHQYDTFPDIPHGFWWSIVTLTTVGYGDLYPKGGLGYLVGSAAAISGCIVTGLSIPIIGNNFNTYYKYMQNQLKEDKYLKELRKDLMPSGNSTGPGNDPTSATPSIYSNSPCPGIFRDQYAFNNNQQGKNKNRKINNNKNYHKSTSTLYKDDRILIKTKSSNTNSPNGRLLTPTKNNNNNAATTSKSNPLSNIFPKSLPKLRIPHLKLGRNISRFNPTPYTQGHKLASFPSSSCNSLETDSSHVSNSNTPAHLRATTIINTPAVTATNNISSRRRQSSIVVSLVTDKERVIDSPEIQSSSNLRSSVVVLQNKSALQKNRSQHGDYV